MTTHKRRSEMDKKLEYTYDIYIAAPASR